MLTILIGRAGSGKSRRVLESIEKNRGLREQILLVPEHTSHEAEVDLCRVCGDTASRSAEVLSFRSLATRVLTEVGGLADFTLDNGGKILTLRRCLQELAPTLKVFGKPSQRVSFLEQMMTLFDEFYAYDVAPEVLAERIGELDSAQGDKLRDVAMLFAAYDAKLHTGEIDARSRMQKLAQAMEKSDYFLGKDLYVDGFSFFNRLEQRILERALEQCETVTVTLLGEKQDGELFRNAAAARDRLIRMARMQGVKCEIVYVQESRDDALGHLEKHFFGTDTAWDGETEQIALYEAGTAFSEVEYVSAQIRRLGRQGYRYRDIGVAARNMDVYGPILERVLERDGIPAYLSRRSDILEKPVLTLLLGAVDAVTGGLEYEEMFRYLKTGLAGISAEECDLLENYVIRWQIRGNMWLRETPWTANPDGYGAEMGERQAQQLAEINRIRDAVRRPLSALAEGLKGVSAAAEKAMVLYEFAVSSGVPETLQKKAEELLAQGQVQLASEYRQLWEIFCGVLDQFVEILGDTPLGGEEFARLLRLVLTQYSVGTIPATLDQVKVSEITRNDRHSVKVLFLLGANDHVLPTLSAQRGILDSGDREELRTREITLSDAEFDELDNELQNIYACLAQATDYLHVSYPVTDVAGSALRPSFVVERIARLFPRVKWVQENGEYQKELPAAALSLAGKNPERELWHYFAGNPAYQETLQAMERAGEMKPGRLSPEAVRALYGKNIPMSASRIHQVKSCHFAYFMQYGLRAKERKAAGFEAPEIGTFIHYLLENVNRDVMEMGGYAAVDSGALRHLVEQYVERYAREEIDGFAEKSARFRYLFSRLRKTAVQIVEDIAAEMRESDFRPLAFELGFGGRDGKLPAITITEGDTTLAVTGKVDRVDGWLHDGKLYLRVVDYKTGKKVFDLVKLRYGLEIQMLLYLFALQNSGESLFGYPIVPGGVLYHPARDAIIKGSADMTGDEIQAALQKELRRSGMVLSEPTVLQAMEHSALESPCYLPISVKKDGSISGYIADAEQLGKLGQYVEKLLHEIAREIGGGNIETDPYQHAQESACDFCPFYAACNLDESRDKRRYFEKTSPERLWQVIDEEVQHE